MTWTIAGTPGTAVTRSRPADRDRSGTRRLLTVLALCSVLGGGLMVTGCAQEPVRPGWSPQPTEETPVKGPVRIDREPLVKRFPKLGSFPRAHWQGWILGDTGRGSAPGPTDTAIQALVELSPQDLQAAKTGYAWAPAPDGWVSRVNSGLRPYLPPSGTWQSSDQFTSDVTPTGHHGEVYLDPTSGTVFLDVTSS